MQHVKLEQLCSQPLPVTEGVPQGSILGPTPFSNNLNDIVCSVEDSSIHLYVDNTVLYAIGPSPDAVLTSLQESFLRVQQAFSTLNLLLNTTKIKVTWFGRKGSVPLSAPRYNHPLAYLNRQHVFLTPLSAGYSLKSRTKLASCIECATTSPPLLLCNSCSNDHPSHASLW